VGAFHAEGPVKPAAPATRGGRGLQRSTSRPSSASPQRAVPGPRGAPWVGVALHLRRDPLRVLLDAADRFGDVVALGHCPHPLYLINHPTLIQQILDQPAHYPKGPSVSRITPLFGAGLTTSDGALWRHQRPMLTAAWQAHQRADLTRIVAAATAEMLARWQPHAQSGQPLDLTAALEDLTWTLMLRVLFGPNTPDPGPTVRAAMQTALAAINQRIWTLWAPPLAFPTRQNRRLRQALYTLETFVHQQFTARWQPGACPADLVTALVAGQSTATGEAMPPRQVRDEILTLWVAGQTTMAAALTWIWLLVGHHPAIEQRLQEDVRSAPWEDLRTAPDLRTLSYTPLLIAEALRLYPPTWVTARSPVSAVELGGYAIPAGAVLLLSPYTMHRHPAFWEVPEHCVPERFLREHARGRPHYAYFPFGGGPRLCLGRGGALQALQVIVALMAWTYRLRLVPGSPVWPVPALTLRPSRALWCTVELQTLPKHADA
jgi:cytochrome P450